MARSSPIALPPRLSLWLCLLSVLALLLFSGLRASELTTTCRRVPRVVSHRGVDEDDRGPTPSTLSQISTLLDEGFGSFDLDLFWAADGGNSLFVGHPPSLEKMWKLAGAVHVTPLATLQERARPEGLLRLRDLLTLLARRRADVGLVSLELKFPSHPDWQRWSGHLYAQVAAAGVAAHVAAVVSSRAEAAIHRAAQSAAGVRVPLLCILRDLDAAVGADGEPHANTTALAEAAHLYDGWSASVKLLEPGLRAAAGGVPLAVWTVDTEAALRRAFLRGPVDDVVSNRPRWASQTLRRWRDEECAGRTP